MNSLKGLTRTMAIKKTYDRGKTDKVPRHRKFTQGLKSFPFIGVVRFL